MREFFACTRSVPLTMLGMLLILTGLIYLLVPGRGQGLIGAGLSLMSAAGLCALVLTTAWFLAHGALVREMAGAQNTPDGNRVFLILLDIIVNDYALTSGIISGILFATGAGGAVLGRRLVTFTSGEV